MPKKKKKKKQDKDVSITKITKRYWFGAYIELVALGFVKEIKQPDRKRGTRRKPRRYKLLKALPLPQELSTLMQKRGVYLHTVPGMVEDFKSSAEEYRDEMEQWADGMGGTGLENTEKFSEVEECRDALSSVVEAIEESDWDSLPESLEDETVFIHPRTTPTIHRRYYKRGFRSQPGRGRCFMDATSMGEAAKGLLQDWLDDEANADDEGRDEVEAMIQSLDTAIDEAGAVDFPGMY